MNTDYFTPVNCDFTAPIMPCWKNYCARRIADGLFSDKDIENLHLIATKGISRRKGIGGPTIIDINTGMSHYSI